MRAITKKIKWLKEHPPAAPVVNNYNNFNKNVILGVGVGIVLALSCIAAALWYIVAKLDLLITLITV